MSKQNDSVSVPGLPKNVQKEMFFEKFDMEHQACVIGSLLDIQKKLSLIKAFTTFKVAVPPQKIDSDIITLLKDIRATLNILTLIIDNDE